MASRDIVRPKDAALSLTMAVVEASQGPLLLLDGDFTVISASESFLEAFDLKLGNVRGARVESLGAGEWASPSLQKLLADTLVGTGDHTPYEMPLERPDHDPRVLTVHAQRLIYLDLTQPRLLVTVVDVTEARADRGAWAEAVRQSAVLLQEVRHRVANSLQVIAAVLLDHARKTPSAETRIILKDAHNRVMSVATLEDRLSRSRRTLVDVRIYFTELLDNIGASLVGEPDRIDLVVTGPGGSVDGLLSVSLGLVVTELVINALKQAFPGGRRGWVRVDCAFRGPNWTLTVTDNGIGPAAGRDLDAGPDATIVRALAKELGATVHIETTPEETRVTVARRSLALVDMSYKTEGGADGEASAGSGS